MSATKKLKPNRLQKSQSTFSKAGSSYRRLSLGFLVPILAVAGLTMGNKGCEDKPAAVKERELRRRVQWNQMVLPEQGIEIPAERSQRRFDFAFSIEAQMPEIFDATNSFSTANANPDQVWDPEGLKQLDQEEFNNCGNLESDSVLSVNTSTERWVPMKQSKMSVQASCLVEAPQAIIEGRLHDFLMTGSDQLSLSFLQLMLAPEINFTVNRYSMSVGVSARRPLMSRQSTLASVNQSTTARDRKAGVRFNLGAGFNLGYNTYRATPLSEMVGSTMTEALLALKSKWPEPWWAMVLRSCDKRIFINGGFGNDANLKKGDVVLIQNITYYWDENPCESSLKGEAIYNEVGYARIVQPGLHMSVAEPIVNDPKYMTTEQRKAFEKGEPVPWPKIHAGARVYLHEMVQPALAPSK